VIRFVHTADWQIGKPFASITDPAKRARVQQERIEAVRRIGSLARDRRAAFVVVAGDLFDSPTPTNATVAAALGAIASIEVPVFCIPGNHDHGHQSRPVGAIQPQQFVDQKGQGNDQGALDRHPGAWLR